MISIKLNKQFFWNRVKSVVFMEAFEFHQFCEIMIIIDEFEFAYVCIPKCGGASVKLSIKYEVNCIYNCK